VAGGWKPHHYRLVFRFEAKAHASGISGIRIYTVNLCNLQMSVILHVRHLSPPSSTPTPLTRPHSWARRRVPTLTVNVDPESGILGLVRARERNKRARCSAASASHGKLGARDVQLGAVEAAGCVQGNVLHAQEVLARRQRAGDGDRGGGLVCGVLDMERMSWGVEKDLLRLAHASPPFATVAFSS
jgi:hypothetical protein